MDAAAEFGRNPVSKYQIQPEYGGGGEQTDARRDCRTRLVKLNSQARRGQGNIHFPCSADHVQDCQSYPVDPFSSCYTCDHASSNKVVIIQCYIGCKGNTSTWHLNGFLDGSNLGSTVLYTYINHHIGTRDHCKIVHNYQDSLIVILTSILRQYIQ